MGFVADTRDIRRYVNVTGKEPELDVPGGAWVVAVRGEVPQPMSGEVWLDPTCVLIGDEVGWFATGGGYKVLEGGKLGPFIDPIIASPGPDQTLPPLAP